jgi:hypothetical protein
MEMKKANRIATYGLAALLGAGAMFGAGCSKSRDAVQDTTQGQSLEDNVKYEPKEIAQKISEEIDGFYKKTEKKNGDVSTGDLKTFYDRVKGYTAQLPPVTEGYQNSRPNLWAQGLSGQLGSIDGKLKQGLSENKGHISPKRQKELYLDAVDELLTLTQEAYVVCNIENSIGLYNNTMPLVEELTQNPRDNPFASNPDYMKKRDSALTEIAQARQDFATAEKTKERQEAERLYGNAVWHVTNAMKSLTGIDMLDKVPAHS